MEGHVLGFVCVCVCVYVHVRMCVWLAWFAEAVLHVHSDKAIMDLKRLLSLYLLLCSWKDGESKDWIIGSTLDVCQH